MPTFEVTSPEGKTYEVTGPEGSTGEQAIAHIKQQTMKPASMPLTDVASQAVTNFPKSAGELLSSSVQPFVHPIETMKSLRNVGQGALEKTGLIGSTGREQYADAVGEFFKNRYGGVENIKKTIANDPVGVMADLATILTFGEAGLARAPGMIGKVGEVAGTAGKIANPLTLPMKALEHGGDITAQVIGNLGTHTGGKSIKEAYRTGVEGGNIGESFRESLRGQVPMEHVVTGFRSALNNARLERSSEYQKGMAMIGKSNEILSFDGIDKALSEANKIKRFKDVDISPSTAKIRQQINDAVMAWKGLPPEYHTPAGFDALKQYIGDIKDSLPYNTPERLVAEKTYGAVRQTIVDQAPEYAKVMKNYEVISDLLSEVEKTLSLGKKATTDTALRKIQSTMRSNVNTNFGKRTELAEKIAEHGSPTLMGEVAGQSLAPWTPGGLGKLTAGVTAAGGYLNPLALATLPFMSPRLMGEATHGLGRAVGAVPKAVRALPGKIDKDALAKAFLASQLAGRAP